MNSREQQFRQRLMATFRAEAEEHLSQIAQGLMAIENALDEGVTAGPAELEPIYRQFHSLKGASQAVGYDEVGRACQGAEGILAGWKADPATIDRATLFRVAETTLQAARLLEVPLPSGFDSQAEAPAAAREHVELERAAPAPPSELSLEAEPRTSGEMAAARPGGGETLRIASDKLDSLLRRGEQLVLARLNSRQRWMEAQELEFLLEGLRHHLEELEGRVEGRRPENNGSTREDPRALATRLHRHVRNLAADHHELDVQLSALLGEVKSARLAPVRPLLEELEMAARRMARQLGKRVRISMQGGELELDRSIMEALKDPLLHLVRNSLDHGFEPMEERRIRGKPLEGQLRVGVASRGTGLMEFRVADDGLGIQTAEVHEAARRQGLMAEGVEVDSLDLIFSSGLSTRREVSDVSGRGLGLAIVRERVEALKGSIRVRTQVGEGTTIILSVPTSLATFEGLVARERGRWLVFPLAGVEAVARLSLKEIRSVEGIHVIPFRGTLAPISRLGEVLNLPEIPGASPAEVTPAVVVAAGGRRAAFLVDEIVGSHEVLNRDLGPQLRRVRYIGGACMLDYQQVAPVLNVVDLLTSVRGTARIAEGQPTQQAPLLLIADDSLTTRTLMRGLLESAGYRVRTAADGSQAWELLHQEDFDLVVSDVDMPGLTGFDLTWKIRSHPRLGPLPIVLVTAHERPQDRQRGLELGASAYILKSRFEEGVLLGTVEKLAGGPAPNKHR